jgi:alpha-tubulin suppressor-like RCC1 family protein
MADTSLRCFGDRHPRTMPPAGLKTRHVTCAHDGCCALMPKEAGGPRIRCWSDKNTIIPPGGFATSVDPVQIAIGYQHGCALNTDGSVACYGQPGTMNAPPAGLKAKSLYAAAFFTCAVKTDDTVTCWGINPPMPPADLKAKLVSAIVHTGGHLDEARGLTRHACAIQLDDTVRCWGDNVEGTTDVPANLGPVRDVGTNSYFSCALKPDGETVCWGSKVLFNDPARLKPRPPNLKLKAIKGQFGGMCGIQLDDTLICWGDEKTSHLSVPPGTKVLIP